MIGAGTINLAGVIVGDHAATEASSAVSRDTPPPGGFKSLWFPCEVLLQF